MRVTRWQRSPRRIAGVRATAACISTKADPTGRAGRVFDLVTSKLRRPPVPPGSVGRPSLIDRLVRDDCCPVVSVAAPPGYGKTTLLSQWAERGGQPFAWVSLDERDNDPKVLLTYIAAALEAVEPIDERVFDALAAPGNSAPGSVVPWLAWAFSSMTLPVTLVLDDVHVLDNPECGAAVSVLADHVPGGSQLVLAGRSEPAVRIARLRAEGKVTEIGARDLAFTHEEASLLLRGAGVTLGEDEIAELYERTEGWPAALYLATLDLREDSPAGRAAASFSGSDRPVSEYIESEFLAKIPQRQRVFLARTAVLGEWKSPLRRSWSARYTPALLCTGGTSRRHARSWSALSACGTS
jgi:LuxR family maltose regulon positive regulatory protein